MKYIKGLCCLLFISMIYGCKDNQLQLKMNTFHIEVGNPIMKEAKYYLDLENYSDKEIENINKNSQFKINSSSENYESVGNYLATITYEDKTYEFDIIVNDHRAPRIEGPDRIYLEVNEKHDFYKDYNVYDYQKVKSLNIDSSKIDISKKGIYDLYIETSDISNNINKRTTKIYVGIKPDNPQSYLMDIPYYNQLDANAPNGCETTALYMALKYKDKISINLESFIKEQPYSKTPYEGFSGDPFHYTKRKDDYYTIFPSPLIQYGNKYSTCRDISNSSIETIKYELSEDHPVIVYVTGGLTNPRMTQHYFGHVTSNLHIVLLNGYDNNKKIFYVKDPIDNNITEVSYDQFEKLYQTMNFAIAVD